MTLRAVFQSFNVKKVSFVSQISSKIFLGDLEVIQAIVRPGYLPNVKYREYYDNSAGLESCQPFFTKHPKYYIFLETLEKIQLN